jgi:hypothetical protein
MIVPSSLDRTHVAIVTENRGNRKWLYNDSRQLPEWRLTGAARAETINWAYHWLLEFYLDNISAPCVHRVEFASTSG